MSQYTRQQTGKGSSSHGDTDECSSHENPATQPHPPGDTCDELPTSTPPTAPTPEECPTDDRCCCPKGPSAGSNCLEDLIAEQAKQVAAADKAKEFETQLRALLGKAKTAAQDYTRDKYDKLVAEWMKQDAQIAELIRKLVCAVPCWYCIIECYICRPILNKLHDAEQELYGDGTLYTEVHNLYDLRYWHERDRDAKKRRFDRIQAVLAVWEKPAQTIEKALADDAKLIVDASNAIGSAPSKAVFDVFLKLVPMHLAIAPPSGSDWMTKIDKKYTEFCPCDEGKPDDCCGPDVGEPSLRQRVIGPQPFLIDPNDYFRVICCLVKNRYAPAKDAWAKADAAYKDVDARIESRKTLIDDGIKSFEKNAKAAIPSTIDCDDYEPPCDDESQTSRAR